MIHILKKSNSNNQSFLHKGILILVSVFFIALIGFIIISSFCDAIIRGALLGVSDTKEFYRLGNNLFLVYTVTVGSIILICGISIYYVHKNYKKLLLEIQNSMDKEDSYSELFSDFIQNINTLTYTEKLIFDYYLDGKSANEVAELMNISMNTIKVHNKHIYTKLNIASKDELALYIRLLKKTGKMFLIKRTDQT